jgi:hypothetical protein
MNLKEERTRSSSAVDGGGAGLEFFGLVPG